MIAWTRKIPLRGPLLVSCASLSLKPTILSFLSKSGSGSGVASSDTDSAADRKGESNVLLKIQRLWAADRYCRDMLQDLVQSSGRKPDGRAPNAAPGGAEENFLPADPGATRSKDKSFADILAALDGGVKRFLSDVAGQTEKAEPIVPEPAKTLTADILDIVPSSVLDDKSKSTLRVLSNLGDMLLSQFKQSVDDLRHPFLINIGLLRLFIVQANATTRPSARAVDREMTEQFLAEAKHFLRYAADVYAESPYISAEDILLNNLQEQFSDVGKNVKIPRHIVFLDHLTRSIVVSIRGTGSVSDVLTDLHFDAVPLYSASAGKGVRGLLDRLSGVDKTEVFAHSGMTHSATALKAPVLEAIRRGMEKRRGKYRDYNVVFTGHSLGAGTACLLSMLVAQEVDFPVKTFAFAPPPVISRQGTTDAKRTFLTGNKSKCSIYSFVHDNDVVTRSSHNEFLNLLAAVACIDKLPWSPKDRMVKLMQGYLTPDEVEEIWGAIKKSKLSDIRKENAGIELLIPGRIFWLLPKLVNSPSSLSPPEGNNTVTKAKGEQKYEVISVEDPSDLFNGSFMTGDSMIADHLVTSYMNSMVNIDTSFSEESDNN